MKVCKTYRFEASHILPNHLGKCWRLHGHSYRVEIEVEGFLNNDTSAPDFAMVMDFGDIDEIVKPIIEYPDGLDHSHLNDSAVSVLGVDYPSAESLASGIAGRLSPSIDELGRDYPGQYSRRLTRVRVYETDKAYAEWTAE